MSPLDPAGGQPPAAQDDRIRELGDQLLRAGRRGHTTYADAVLDNSAFRILWQIIEHGVDTQRDLSEALQLEQSTISRQVRAAVSHGLLEQRPAAGAATRVLAPTAAGRRAYDHDGALRAARFRDAMSRLGGDETSQLIDLLRRFNDAMDAANV